MKKARFLNSVGKKYIVGYVIVAVFSVILLMVAVICNNYVSGQYDNAIGEMISINNLENSVEVLNGDINMAYLYLSEEGTENYEQDRKSAEQYLKNSEGASGEKLCQGGNRCILYSGKLSWKI